MVGLIFDGNFESLMGDCIDDETQNRAVSVSSAAISEALRKIYNAGALVDQLGKSPGEAPPLRTIPPRRVRRGRSSKLSRPLFGCSHPKGGFVFGGVECAASGDCSERYGLKRFVCLGLVFPGPSPQQGIDLQSGLGA
jgi:hypothetical protein